MCAKISEKIPKLGVNHNYNNRHRSLLASTRHSLEIFKKKPMTAKTRFFN